MLNSYLYKIYEPSVEICVPEKKKKNRKYARQPWNVRNEGCEQKL